MKKIFLILSFLILILIQVPFVGLSVEDSASIDYTLQPKGVVSTENDNDGLIAVWLSTGNNFVEISGSQRIAVNVTNFASVTCGMYLTAEVSGGSITPLDMTVNNLEQNIPQTVYFDVSNLGTDQDKEVTVTISARDTYTGNVISQEDLYATLLQTISTPTTSEAQTQNTQENGVDSTLIIVALILAVAIIVAAIIVKKR